MNEQATLERRDKVDGFLGISCYKDEIADWNKYLVPKREKISRAVRAILNQEVIKKKKEMGAL